MNKYKEALNRMEEAYYSSDNSMGAIYGTLLEMYGKGHFKGIDTSTPIREILDNCKVV